MNDKLKSDPHLCSKCNPIRVSCTERNRNSKNTIFDELSPQFLAENYFYLTNVVILKHEKRVRPFTTPPLVAKRR